MIERLIPIFAVIGVASFAAYLALFVYVGWKKMGLERFCRTNPAKRNNLIF